MKKQTKLISTGILAAVVLMFTGCQPTTSTPPETITNDVIGPEQPAIALTGTETSVEFTSKMTVGWNLGNALDASNCGDWAYSTGLAMEYSWLPHKQATSQNLIKAVKKAGFNTIRIPISWHNHMTKDTTTYQIDSAWMNRVKTIVDWAIAEDMFVIINIHHDNLTETEIASNPGFCISTDEAIQTKSEAFIEKVWEQIATTFKDYDNRLVFEILNEPRCVGTSMEWGFWTDDKVQNAGKESIYCPIITKYEQKGLNAIRSSGGNNATRFVMAPGYAASPAYLSAYSLPTDTASDKLLLSTHAYTPNDFALDGDKSDYDSNKSYIEGAIDGVFNDLYKNYVKKGTGVVMGEASASDKKNTTSRVKWAKYYFAKAKAVGIPIVLWDNEQSTTDGATVGGENHGYFNRVTCKQYFPAFFDAIMKAVYGSSYTPGDSGNDDPETPVTTTEKVLFEGSFDLTSWEEHKTFNSSDFSNATSSSKLVFTTDTTEGEGGYVNIKLQSADWNSVFYTGTVTGGSIGGDNNDVIVVDANSKGFTYTPTADEWATIKSKGLIVYGWGIKIKKITLQY